MKPVFSRILSCFYFWNFKRSSFNRKRKKVIKGKKYRTERKRNLPVKKSDLIICTDDKGLVCFSIQIDALFYIESDTNYITLFYINHGKMDKFLMRSSLKKVLEENRNDNLLRCHRSYIVNFEKVKMYKKDKEGGKIELSHDSLPTISVSKTYLDNVLKRFQN